MAGLRTPARAAMSRRRVCPYPFEARIVAVQRRSRSRCRGRYPCCRRDANRRSWHRIASADRDQLSSHLPGSDIRTEPQGRVGDVVGECQPLQRSVFEKVADLVVVEDGVGAARPQALPRRPPVRRGSPDRGRRHWSGCRAGRVRGRRCAPVRPGRLWSHRRRLGGSG